MGFEIFLFGFVMLILIALTAYLVVRAMRSSEKPAEIESRMRELYIRMDELLDATEAYVEESKEEIEAKLEQMEIMLQRIEGGYTKRDYVVYEPSAEIPQRDVQPREMNAPQKKIKRAEPVKIAPKRENNDEFSKKIRQMSGSGASAGNIAEELGASKGAVELVLNLMGKDKK